MASTTFSHTTLRALALGRLRPCRTVETQTRRDSETESVKEVADTPRPSASPRTRHTTAREQIFFAGAQHRRYGAACSKSRRKHTDV